MTIHSVFYNGSVMHLGNIVQYNKIYRISLWKRLFCTTPKYIKNFCGSYRAVSVNVGSAFHLLCLLHDYECQLVGPDNTYSIGIKRRQVATRGKLSCFIGSSVCSKGHGIFDINNYMLRIGNHSIRGQIILLSHMFKPDLMIRLKLHWSCINCHIHKHICFNVAQHYRNTFA